MLRQTPRMRRHAPWMRRQAGRMRRPDLRLHLAPARGSMVCFIVRGFIFVAMPTQKAASIVERLQQRLDELPLLPAVVLKLLRIDARSEDYFEQVSGLIAQDPPFAIRVLKVANSAAMTCAHTHVKGVHNLHDAIMRIGARGAVDLVVAHSATRVFLPRTDWERSLWVHALSVGVLAERLSRHLKPPAVDSTAAYLAGLLHDMGRFILYLEAPEHLRAVDETEWDTPTALIDAEQAICGFSHAELGFLAAQKWKLPEDLAVVIRNHHAPDPAPPQVPAHLVALVRLVRVADWLAVLCAKGDWEHAGDAELGRLAAPQIARLFTADAAQLVPEIRAGLRQAATTASGIGL